MLSRFVDSPPDQSASKSARIILLSGLIAAAAVLWLVPHPPNFAPIGAMALFGGACFADRRVAFLLPLAALFLSDLVLGLHVLVPVVYGSFAVNVLLGRWLRGRRRFVPVALATLAGSLQFFVMTNFAYWLLWYPHTWTGLVTCYVAALLFFHNTLLGDATFVGVLFGAMALAEAGFPALRERALPAAT
ncbi:MAG: DUF6580 family putative transport protein [Microthrixaceae bacterium]